MDVQLTLIKALVGLYYNGFKHWLHLTESYQLMMQFITMLRTVMLINLLAHVILIINIFENTIILYGLIFADV